MQVDCYYNLHKKCLSLRHKGKVIKHTESVTLKDVTFIVFEKGRQRVLKNKRKNVHAVVRGQLVDISTKITKLVDISTRVKYNPYFNDSFITDDNFPIYNANNVTIHGKNIYVIS